MDFINEFNKVILEVSNVLGKPIDKDKYEIIDRGSPHQAKSLSNKKMAVYTFWYESRFLKIGKAGPNSNARFLSQH